MTPGTQMSAVLALEKCLQQREDLRDSLAWIISYLTDLQDWNPDKNGDATEEWLFNAMNLINDRR